MTAITRPQVRLHYGRGVSGVRRLRGLGQYDAAGNYIGPTDTVGNPLPDYGTGANILTPTGQLAPGAFPIDVSGTVTPAAGSGGGTNVNTSPFNLTTFLSNVVSTAGKTAQTALSPYSALAPGTTLYTTPSGTMVSTAGAAGSNLLSSLNLGSTLSSMLPILLIGGAAILLVSMMGRK